MKQLLKLFVIPVKMILKFTKLILYFFQFIGGYFSWSLSLLLVIGVFLGIAMNIFSKSDIILCLTFSFFFFLIPIFIQWLIEKIDDLIDFLDYLSI